MKQSAQNNIRQNSQLSKKSDFSEQAQRLSGYDFLKKIME